MKVRLPIRPAILKRKTFEPPSEDREKKIRLDFNENTSGCSAAVRRAIARISTKEFAMYPDYGPATRRLARYFGVRTAELLLTNGADDALRAFFDAFVEEGSSILICEPTFPMYRYYAEIFGARVEALHYTTDMSFPLLKVLSALRKKPRVLFIANPNNPTGTLLARESILRILKAAPRTAVVIDEAYAEFSRATIVPLVRRHAHLFVVRTFSKAAGLAGLRLGAILANEKSLELLRRTMPPFPVNIAALVSARAAVENSTFLRCYAREVNRLRGWFAAELRKMGVRTFPSAGNFLLADFGFRGPALFQRVERQGVLLRERSREIAPGFVRITIGTFSEMQTLLRLIRKEFKSRPA